MCIIMINILITKGIKFNMNEMISQIFLFVVEIPFKLFQVFSCQIWTTKKANFLLQFSNQPWSYNFSSQIRCQKRISFDMAQKYVQPDFFAWVIFLQNCIAIPKPFKGYWICRGRHDQITVSLVISSILQHACHMSNFTDNTVCRNFPLNDVDTRKLT